MVFDSNNYQFHVDAEQTDQSERDRDDILPDIPLSRPGLLAPHQA